MRHPQNPGATMVDFRSSRSYATCCCPRRSSAPDPLVVGPSEVPSLSNSSSVAMSSAAQMANSVATDGWVLPVSSWEMKDAETSKSLANWRRETPRVRRLARMRAPTRPGASRSPVPPD